MNDFIYHFSYPVNFDLLRKQCNDSEGYVIFSDPKDGKLLHGWSQKRIDNGEGYGQDLSKEISNLIGSKECRPRFYIQEPHFNLDWHQDRGSRCGINFMLGEHPEPVTFNYNDPFDVTYKIALLNTEKWHCVKGLKHRRRLFKLSIFDMSYEEVREKLLTQHQ